MCDPCLPVGRACRPSVAAVSLQRTAWSRRGWRATASSSTASARAAAGSAPCIARIAGMVNSRKVTIADTGLPGSPNASTRRSGPSRVPNHVGLPGLSATPQKDSATPRSRSAPFT